MNYLILILILGISRSSLNWHTSQNCLCFCTCEQQLKISVKQLRKIKTGVIVGSHYFEIVNIQIILLWPASCLAYHFIHFEKCTLSYWLESTIANLSYVVYPFKFGNWGENGIKCPTSIRTSCTRQVCLTIHVVLSKLLTHLLKGYKNYLEA